MRRVLQQWARSGLTLEAFGQREGIPRTTLVWWRHVFRHAPKRRRATHGHGAGPAARVVAAEPARFREVHLPRREGVSPPVVLEVVLRRGHLVRVPGGVDVGTLQAVIAVLEGGC
jgi:hypothetical protein